MTNVAYRTVSGPASDLSAVSLMIGPHQGRDANSGTGRAARAGCAFGFLLMPLASCSSCTNSLYAPRSSATLWGLRKSGRRSQLLRCRQY